MLFKNYAGYHCTTHILIPLHSFQSGQVNTPLSPDKRILPEYGECFAFENGLR